MLLSVQERLIMLSILPAEGDLTSLRVIRDVKMALGFTEEEIATIGFSYADGRTTWKTDMQTEIAVGPKVLTIVHSAFGKLNQNQALTLDMLPLYERLLAEWEK